VILNVILPGLFLLGILVFLHELGHFLMAKWLHVPVYKFSLGFGPAIYRYTRGETQYQVSILPLGGYVSMAEETKDAEGREDLVDRFSEQPWWKRFIIALAGPGANFVTGYVALILMALVGVQLPDFDAVMGPVAADSPAARAGLVEGVRIARVGDAPVVSFQDFLLKSGEVPQDRALELAVEDPAAGARTITVPAAQRADVFSSLAPPETPSVIGNVVLGNPAYAAGLAAGDRIVAIDGKPIARWRELTTAVTASAGKPLRFTVQRDQRTFDVSITPMGPPTPGAWEGGRIGIEAPRVRTYLERSTFGEAVSAAWPRTVALVGQTFAGIGGLLLKPFESAGSLGGPQMIVQIAGQSAQRGLGDFIYVLAAISFAIMAFNLIPMPVLDGGHLFLALVEAVRRRPPAAWFTAAYQRVGLVVMGGFIVFVLYNDLSRSIQHRAAVHRNNQAPPGEVAPTR
jgi:regulator of sigma E protease